MDCTNCAAMRKELKKLEAENERNTGLIKVIEGIVKAMDSKGWIRVSRGALPPVMTQIMVYHPKVVKIAEWSGQLRDTSDGLFLEIILEDGRTVIWATHWRPVLEGPVE